MKTEVIAVGTEILLGQIVNTNAQYISKKLAEEGIGVYYHSVVGDNPIRLAESIKTASERADLIIFTGGLGPTADDVTKEILAQHLDVKLVIDEASQKQLESFYAKRQATMTKNNLRQAEVIAGAHIFPNDHGLAPGMSITHENKHYILMPGPPSEMIPMLNTYVIPYLRQLRGEKSIIYSKVLNFFGIGESKLETDIKDLIENQSDPTIAPYAKEAEVSLRITTQVPNAQLGEQRIAPIVDEIYRRLGHHIYSEGEDKSLQATLYEAITKRGATVSCAESCTGGLVSEWITSIPGSSGIFNGSIICYSNYAKEHVLNIPSELLATHGAVSYEVASRLATEVRSKLNTDWGVSVTGITGPQSIEGKPVGLVYIGISSGELTDVEEFVFVGSRRAIQVRAAKTALYMLLQKIKER